MSLEIEIPNFSEYELCCTCGGDCQYNINFPIQNLDKLACHLQVLRNLWGKPLKINSAYRCPKYNKSVGGVPRSQHVKGLAADISTKRWSASKKDDFKQLAIEVGFNGIGRYDSFIHVDLRKSFAFWDMRTK